MDIGGLKKVH